VRWGRVRLPGTVKKKRKTPRGDGWDCKFTEKNFVARKNRDHSGPQGGKSTAGESKLIVNSRAIAAIIKKRGEVMATGS